MTYCPKSSQGRPIHRVKRINESGSWRMLTVARRCSTPTTCQNILYQEGEESKAVRGDGPTLASRVLSNIGEQAGKSIAWTV
ncbi:hypothetical protein PoB_007531800 [Plakobranchus ocellatus]|uniref:Uncharacterized protein n=1 Tax=Plakobranchus ocellatus TaxID=259542 RepID=A0AAV4DX28_9GAST|nr:hypothetical protein PoB_007531800 [Plakobranchus ocellatus]